MSEPGTMDEWIATRPASVQALAKQFPPGTRFQIEDGPVMWVIGYTENDMLIVSAIAPWGSEGAYQRALAAKQYIHARHLAPPRRRNAHVR